MLRNPEHVQTLITRISQLPHNIYEDVLQEALQEAGRVKGMSWEDMMSELHTTYLYHLKEENQVKERWAWLKVALENESTDGLANALQLLIEAMGKQQGRTWQETCEAIETPIDALALEAHVRKAVVMSVLLDTTMPQLIAILSCVQENIEKARGLEPGTLIREIARASKPEAKVLHLHARVLKVNAVGLCNQIEFLLGKGQTVLLLDIPPQLEDERIIYYKQPLSSIPHESGGCITDKQLVGVLRTIEFDTRCFKLDFTINENDGFEAL